MRRFLLLVAMFGMATSSFAGGSIAVTSVEAHQRYPWNGLVDIVVTIQGDTNKIAVTECMFLATNSSTQTAVPVSAIRQVGGDTFLKDSCIRRYLWDAQKDIKETWIVDLALTANLQKKLGGVQLWENGPYWAECNIGATKPEEYGFYFWWGDTVGYKRNENNDGWISVKDETAFSFTDNNCPTYHLYKYELKSQGYVDATGNLAAEHDAASAHLGAPWRLPTNAEMWTLISNCTTIWITTNGIAGRLVTGNGDYASRSIFLPAAGCGHETGFYSFGIYGEYWTSSPYVEDYCAFAMHNYFTSSEFSTWRSFRSVGYPVRPIRENGSEDMGVGTTTHLKLDCRIGMRVPSSGGEVLCYDVSWCEKGEEIRLLDEGTVITNGIAGSFVWCPKSTSSVNTLKLEVLSGGEVICTETAQFGFGYVRNVTARQLYPHKKVEVCYDLAEDIGDVTTADSVLQLTVGDSDAAETVFGDTRCVAGHHCIAWDLENDGVLLKSNAVEFTVKYGIVSGVSSPTDIDTSNGVRICGTSVSVTNYIFAGLSGCWDGVCNVGTNLHSGDSIIWKDLSGKGWHASKVGTCGVWTKCGFAFTRTGTGYFELPDGFLASLGKSWTVEAYVRPTASAKDNYAGICGGHDASVTTGMAMQSWDDVLTAFVQVDQSLPYGKLSLVKSSDPWPTEQNVHFAFTMDNESGLAKAWRNGSAVDSYSFDSGSAPSLTCQKFWIGRAFDGDNRMFDGVIYAIRVYNRALTDAEILMNRNFDYMRFGSQSGLYVGQSIEMAYSLLGSDDVILEVNGRSVFSDTEDGMYVWTPTKPGSYVLTHRAGNAEFQRRIVVNPKFG